MGLFCPHKRARACPGQTEQAASEGSYGKECEALNVCIISLPVTCLFIYAKSSRLRLEAKSSRLRLS